MTVIYEYNSEIFVEMILVVTDGTVAVIYEYNSAQHTEIYRPHSTAGSPRFNASIYRNPPRSQRMTAA